MKMITFVLMLISLPVAADFEAATWSLMDEEKIEYMSSRDSLGLKVLVLGLSNNGADRNGFAEYVCLVLKDHDVNHDVLIKVIDSETWSQEKKERLIGSYSCRHT